MSAYPARVEPDSRVLSPSTCVASQTGFSATGLFDLECSLNDEVDMRRVRQGEENNYAVSGDDDGIDDGISPDDAPEMVRDDLNEEKNSTAPNVGTLGRPQTSADAIKAMAAYLEDQMFAGFGALRVAHGKKGDGRRSPLPDTKSKKGKKGLKKSKSIRVTTEESSRQMPTSGCAESSRTRLKESVAEDLTVPSRLSNTLSTSMAQQGESQQPGKRPLKIQDALQLEDNNHPAPAPLPPPPVQITPVACVSPPGASAAQTTTESRGQDSTLSGVDGSHSATSPRESDKDALIVTGNTPYDGPRVAYKSEQVKLVDETRIAFGETGRTESEQRVTEHDENLLPLVQNLPVACGGHTPHRVVHPGRLGTAGRVVADLRPSSSSVSPNKPPRNWYLRELDSLNVDSDDEVDMEAPDAFIPMDEDEVGQDPSFGLRPASNIAFDPCLAYQPLPYNYDTDLEQINALNNGLGTVQDSVMEDAGTELAVETVVPTQAIQQPLVNTLSSSSVDYGLFSNDQFYTGIQTAAVGNNSMHYFQSTMLSNLNALENNVPAHAGFPQYVPPQEIAWDVVQSSAPVLAVESFREQLTVANVSPAPALSAPAGYPTTQFSSHASSPSPPRAGPTPASSPTHRAIDMRTNGVEVLAGVVDPQPPVVAGIQREASPFRSRVTVRDADATQKPLQHARTEPEDAFPAKSGLNTASSNHSISTSATPTKPKEDAGKQVNEGGINNDKRSRKEEQGTVDSILKVTRHFIRTSPPIVRPTATTRSPSPAVPAVPTRVAGSKRKFTDDQDARCDSTNHLELPRLKKRKFEHAAYSTHAGLEKVKAMDRRRGMEATSLTEAINLAGRRRLAAWSSLTAPTGGMANPGAPKGSA